jgi:hypothetical protein
MLIVSAALLAAGVAVAVLVAVGLVAVVMAAGLVAVVMAAGVMVVAAWSLFDPSCRFPTALRRHRRRSEWIRARRGRNRSVACSSHP